MRKTLLALFCIATGALHAQGLRLEEGFVLPTAARKSVPLFLHFANPTSQSVVIAGAVAPFTNRVVLRQHTKRDGKTVIESGGTITIPAKSRVKLLPGATELVMLNLAEPLQGGTEFPLVLQFASGQTQVVRVKVRNDTNSLTK
jgi:copper(I)-binding protein